MTSRLFYAWLPDGADADAHARAEAVIARLRSSTVAINAVEGGYSVNVTGADSAERESVANRVASRLYNEGGLRVGRRSPGAPAVTLPVPPATVVRTRVTRPPVTRRKVVPQPDQAITSGAARVLIFMRNTFMREPTLSFLTSRLQMGTSVVNRHLESLIEQGLVEELPGRAYRLTEYGRQTP